MRTSALTIGLVMLAAILLRFWALDSGIPYTVGPDEPVVMDGVVQAVKSGDFNPHRVDSGGAFFYVQTAVAAARFLTGATRGEWSSLDQAQARDFYPWARRVAAVLGAATVLLVYLIGLRWGARHALLGAGLMAVMPQHVGASHHVLVAVPTTFLVTLTMLLSLRASEKATRPAFAWAGFVAGVAASVTHTGGLALLLPVLAAWMTLEAQPSRTRAALAAVGACAAGFIVGAPYTLLDLPTALNGFAAIANAEANVPSGWLRYLAHLRDGMGWPALILAASGLVLGTVRAINGPGRVRWTLALLFPLVFLYVLASNGPDNPTNLLPVLPFTCLLAASAVVSGVSILRRFDIARMPRTALIIALTVASLLTPSIQAVNINRILGKRTTAAQAYDWIMREVPTGSVIVVEPGGLWLPPDRYVVEYVSGHAADDVSSRLPASGRYIVCGGDRRGEDPRDHPAIDDAQELVRFQPSGDHPGPELRVYRRSRSTNPTHR